MTVEKDTVFDIANRVALAIEGAAKEHGAEAIELALLAYRVTAIKYLAMSFIGVLVVLIGVWVWHWIYRKADSHPDTDWDVALFVYTVLSVPFGIFIAANVIAIFTSIPHWAAAFGSPELWIATKALQAGGLL